MLKRGASFHELQTDDIPWFWAGYRLGGFPLVPDGADTEDFRRIMGRYEGHVYTLLAPTKDEASAPVGLVVLIRKGQHVVEPHFTFLPWATCRNKVETTVNFFLRTRSKWTALVWGREDVDKFWLTVARYGVLVRGNFIERYFDDGQTAHLSFTQAS